MQNILGELSQAPAQYNPTTIQQYTALQIFLNLKGQSLIREYSRAAESYALPALIEAFKRTVLAGRTSLEFFQYLRQRHP